MRKFANRREEKLLHEGVMKLQLVRSEHHVMTDTATATQSGMAMTTFRTNPDAGFDSKKIMFVQKMHHLLTIS